MRLTEGQLRRIIREELESTMVNEGMFDWLPDMPGIPDLNTVIGWIGEAIGLPPRIAAQLLDAAIRCGWSLSSVETARILWEESDRLKDAFGRGGVSGSLEVLLEIFELQGVSVTANCMPEELTSWITEHAPNLLPRRD